MQYAVEAILPRTTESAADVRLSLIIDGTDHDTAHKVAAGVSRLSGVDGTLVTTYQDFYGSREVAQLYGLGMPLSDTLARYLAEAIGYRVAKNYGKES